MDKPNPQLVDKAEQWLKQTLEDLKREYHERDFYPMVFRLKGDLERYAPTLQSAVDMVLARWLLSDDLRQAYLAHSLITIMGRTGCIPAMEKLLQDLGSGQSPLRERLQLGLESLRNRQAAEG